MLAIGKVDGVVVERPESYTPKRRAESHSPNLPPHCWYANADPEDLVATVNKGSGLSKVFQHVYSISGSINSLRISPP